MTDISKFVFFKPVEYGYLYQAPNKWLAGTCDHYLVDEAQKSKSTATISAISRPVVWIVTIVWLALFVLVAAPSVWATLHGYYSLTLNFVIGLSASVVAWYAAQLMARHLVRARLLPIIVTLTPTDQKITKAELRAALSKVVASGQALSPLRRNILKACCIVGPLASLLVLFAKFMDVREMRPYASLASNLYTASFNFTTLLVLITILSFGFMYVKLGRVPSTSAR